jgi:hypothetical protein
MTRSAKIPRTPLWQCSLACRNLLRQRFTTIFTLKGTLSHKHKNYCTLSLLKYQGFTTFFLNLFTKKELSK